jgi:hypothetical protein
MMKKIRRIYRDTLRLVINHKCLYNTIGGTDLFGRLVIKEAKMIVRGQ